MPEAEKESHRKSRKNDSEGAVYIFDLGNGNFIDGNVDYNHARFINHSCEPNCMVDDNLDVVTIKPVKKGEELTFDYATSQKSFPFRFNCRCGSLDCRGEIGDYSELSGPRKAYYLSKGVIAPYLVQRAESIRNTNEGKAHRALMG